MRRTTSHRCGLTLVELVVVLAIVVMLAGVAISVTEGTLEGVLEEARFDTSRSTLVNIEHAVLGPFEQQAPALQPMRPWATGFVSDMGRLPRFVDVNPSLAEVELQLVELWAMPAGASPFGVYVPPGDPELRIACGWRGPYLRLAIGDTRLFDAWGNLFVARRADSSASQPGDEVAQFITLGADGLPGGSDYAADAVLRIHATDLTPPIGPRHIGAIPIRVVPETGTTSKFIVRIYGPGPGIEPIPLDGEPQTLVQAVLPDSDGKFTCTLGGVTIGRRLLRVYETNDTDLSAVVADPNLPLTLGGGVIPITRMSRPINVDLPQGGVSEIEIEWP